MEENYLRDKSFGFEIAHVLRELGFRKESKFYYVKAGKIVGSFLMRQNNFWNFKHYDFNKSDRFVPSMGEPWIQNNHYNFPIFDNFGFSGYICTCPTYKQVFDFCDSIGITLSNKKCSSIILCDLILFYRKKVHQDRAFEKYWKIIMSTMNGYDHDTILSQNNGVEYKKHDKWVKEHLQEIRSKTAMSPRGEWFWYASVFDGHIYAIGEEQGNYAGGDLCSVRGGENRLKAFIEERMANASPDSYEGSLYEKIKDMPVATFEMYQEMERTLLELAKEDAIHGKFPSNFP